MTKTEYKKHRSNYRRAITYMSKHAIKKKLAMAIQAPAWAHYGMLLKLHRSIRAEIQPILNATQAAWDKLGNGVTPYLESSPEQYASNAKRARTMPDTYRMHGRGTSADCEMAETSPAWANAQAMANRNWENSPEAKLAEMKVEETNPQDYE